MHDPLQELTIGARDGEGVALARLHARLFKPLARFLARFVGADVSVGEDLASEALAEAFDSLRSGRYDPNRARFTTFVYAIGRSRAMRHRRMHAKSVETAISDLPNASMDDVPDARLKAPDHTFDSAEIEAMLECLRSDHHPYGLSPEERFVIVGLAEGDTLEALARKLGRSISTVHDRKTRAVEKLRRCLGAKGFISERSP